MPGHGTPVELFVQFSPSLLNTLNAASYCNISALALCKSMPYQVNTQYVKILNITVTSIKRCNNPGQPTSMIKGCMAMCLIWLILPVDIEDHWSSAGIFQSEREQFACNLKCAHCIRAKAGILFLKVAPLFLTKYAARGWIYVVPVYGLHPRLFYLEGDTPLETYVLCEIIGYCFAIYSLFATYYSLTKRGKVIGKKGKKSYIDQQYYVTG